MPIVGSFKKDGTFLLNKIEVKNSMFVEGLATIQDLKINNTLGVTGNANFSNINANNIISKFLEGDGTKIVNIQWNNIAKKPTTIAGYGIVDAYTKTETDTNIANAISELRMNIQWKDSVPTYDDLAVIYPTPKEGWTVSIEDTNEVYRYDEQTKEWIQIDAGKIPMASATLDGKMSKEHFVKVESIQTGAEVNQNAYSNIKFGTKTSSATTKTDTFEFANGSDIDMALDGKKLTISHTNIETTASTKSSNSGSANILYSITTDKGHVIGSTYKTITAGTNMEIDSVNSRGDIKISNTYRYTHPTGDGNLHVPATGTTNNGKFLMAGANPGDISWDTPPLATTRAHGYLRQLTGATNQYMRADGTWATPNDTTYAEYAGTIAGLVPNGTALSAGEKTTKFLRGDGKWEIPYTLPTATASTLGGIMIGTGLAIASGKVSVPNVTTTANGLMLSADKVKLDGIANNANNYVHPTQARSNTTNTVSPGYSGTFTVIDSIGTNAEGHVSSVNTKTVTMPSQYVLPKATKTALGGIIVGDNINVGADGKISIANYEPAFTKKTAFNKDFGTADGTVAKGNHTHSEFTSTRHMIATDQSSNAINFNTNKDYIATNRIVRLGTTQTNLGTAPNYGTVMVIHGGGDTGAQLQFPYNSNDIYFRNYSFAATPNLDGKAWSRIWNSSNFNPATKVDTTRKINVSGAITGGGDLTADRTISHSTAAGYVHLPSGGSAGQWLKWASNGTGAWTTPGVLVKGSYLTGGNYDGNAGTTWSVDATSDSTASKIVARDGNGYSSFKSIRSELANQTGSMSGAALAYRTSAADGHIRFTTDASAVRSWLGVTAESTGALRAYTLPNNLATVCYSRIATMTANIGDGKSNLTAVIMGGTNFGSQYVPMIKLSFSTRGYSGSGELPSNMVEAIMIGGGSGESEIKFITKLNGSNIELWMKTPAYPYPPVMQVFNISGGSINADSGTATAPTGTVKEYSITTKVQNNSITSPSFIGNSSSATKLQTARTINGVNFDGTTNINVPTQNTLTRGSFLTGGNFNGSSATTWAVDATSDATGGKIVARDSAGDVTGRLFRSTYANENNLTGAIAFRVNNSSDNYTRYCSNPASVRAWLNLEGSLTSYVQKAGDTMTGVLTVPAGTGLRTSNSTVGSETYYTGISAESGYSMIWRRSADANKADEFIGITRDSRAVIRVATGGGKGNYKEGNIYHSENKPTKADVGLGSVNNWGASSNINANSTAEYATTNMVAQIKALVETTGSDYIKSLGILSAETGRNTHRVGAYTFNTNNATLGDSTPTAYWSTIGFGRGNQGMAEIACDWTSNGNNLWFRSLRDTQDNWFSWKRIYHTGYKPSATDVGLGNVNNWGASNDAGNNSTSTYATTAYVVNRLGNVNNWIASTDANNNSNTTYATTSMVHNRIGRVNNWGASSNIDANSTAEYATTNMVAQLKANLWNRDDGDGGLNSMFSSNRFYSGSSNNDTSSLGGIYPWGAYMSAGGRNACLQLYAPHSGGGTQLYFRRRWSSENGSWHTIYHTANKPTASDVGALPNVGYGGVHELGRYLDLHVAGSTADYDARIWTDGGQTVLTSGDFHTNGRVFIHRRTEHGGTPSISVAIGDSDTGFNWASDGAIQIWSNNQNKGYWNTGEFYFGSQITSGANVVAYSDIRLKKDLEVITDAIDKVKKLSGYTYTRIDTGERQTGVVAQEVQKVLPEAVVESTSSDTLAVAYGNMVGLLIEAIKEQQKEIDEIKRILNIDK